MRIKSFLIRILNGVLDVVLPPVCLGCDSAVAGADALCPDCWKAINRIAPPFCACCGTPFPFAVDAGTLCARCLTTPPVFTAARSAILYDEGSKPIILRFKHADRIHPTRGLALWMYQACPDFWGQVDVLVPMPLHRRRLWRRRYNQAALLAHALGRLGGKPVDLFGLVRVRATASQGHLGGAARRANVKGAFAVRHDGAARLAGKTVLLVDDVMTTGASADEASRVLLTAGAARVFVLTLALAKTDRI